ncbi:MAG: ATP-binding protein [Bacillota bacterium]|nr:ATP-binding protein [Bacillota bacterium]
MDPGELEDLIRPREDSYTEFKRGTIHPDDLAASIAAFANSGGGVLVRP